MNQLTSSLASLTVSPRTRISFPQPVVKRNTHSDDIHVLLRLQDGFVTGSKDGFLKKWNLDFASHQVLDKQIGYEYWFTAGRVISDKSFVVARRDGTINFFNTQTGKHTEYTLEKRFQTSTCKKRNIFRVDDILPLSALPAFENDDKSLLLGTPGSILLFHPDREIEFPVHSSEWIYRIVPITGSQLGIVAGSGLGVFQFTNEEESLPSLKRKKWLIDPQHPDLRFCDSKSQTRKPHISDLYYNNDKFIAACFDGNIREIPVSTKKRAHDDVFLFGGHVGRVWCVCPIPSSPQVFLSGAEDGTIRLWDIRQGATVWTSKVLEGRVSNVIPGNSENFFISTSCPKVPQRSPSKACVRVWDLRQLNKIQLEP